MTPNAKATAHQRVPVGRCGVALPVFPKNSQIFIIPRGIIPVNTVLDIKDQSEAVSDLALKKSRGDNIDGGVYLATVPILRQDIVQLIKTKLNMILHV